MRNFQRRRAENPKSQGTKSQSNPNPQIPVFCIRARQLDSKARLANGADIFSILLELGAWSLGFDWDLGLGIWPL
jgi:hypothetical protein